jgi:hypothetical protein
MAPATRAAEMPMLRNVLVLRFMVMLPAEIDGYVKIEKLPALGPPC